MAELRFSEDQVRGFHGAYVSNARIWSATTRTLLQPGRTPGEVELALVALWKCLAYTELLVVGRPKQGIPPNAEAREDMPLPLADLQRQLKLVDGLRDELLHLQNMVEPGRGYNLHFTHDEPRIRFSSSMNNPKGTRGRGSFVSGEITLREIEALLDAIDPWLQTHHRRWIAVAVEANSSTDDENETPDLTGV